MSVSPSAPTSVVVAAPPPLSTADRFAQMRKEHFDAVIPDLVASAVAARAADDFRAAVAAQVAEEVGPMHDAAAEAQMRIESLTRALDTVEAERVAPLQAERDALAARVEQLTEALEVAIAQADNNESANEAEAAARDEQAAAASAELVALQGRYQGALAASAELAERVEKLESQVVTSAAEHGDATAAMHHDATAATAALTARVTALEAARDAAENERDERAAEADVLKIKLAAVLKDRAAAAAQVAKLEESVDTLTARIRDLGDEDGSDEGGATDTGAWSSGMARAQSGSGFFFQKAPPATALGNSPMSGPPGGESFAAGSPTATTVAGAPASPHTQQPTATARRAKRRGRDQAGIVDTHGSRHAGNTDRSARAEVLEFWRDGHDRIAVLESERDGLMQELSEARAKAAGASELVEMRPRLVASLAAVTVELETAREEHRRTAAALVAARAEAQALQSHLTAALHTAMSSGDIAACAAALRTAAERSASAEAATLALDPAAAKRAAQELQALQHELVEQRKAKAQLVATNMSLRDSVLALQTASVAYRCITGTADVAAAATTGGNSGWGMLPPPSGGPSSTTATAGKAPRATTNSTASAPVVPPEVLALVTRALAPPVGADNGGDDSVVTSSAATIASDLKLKRLQDLQAIAKLKSELATTAAARDAAESARSDLEGQLAELRASSERDSQRLAATATHSRDELRSTTATLAATKREFEELRNASAARNEAAAALRAVTAVLADQLLTTTAAAAEARAAAVAARREVAVLSRGRDAAVRRALATLGDDVLVAQLDRQLAAADAELQRRRRRDEANDASTHARLMAELSKQAVALEQATSRARDLADAASGTATAREESERWCATVEEALAALRREHAEAVRAATTAAAVVPAELTRGLVSACSAGLVAAVPAARQQQQAVAPAVAPAVAASQPTSAPATLSSSTVAAVPPPPASERAQSSDDDMDDDNPFGSSFLATTTAAFASADAALAQVDVAAAGDRDDDDVRGAPADPEQGNTDGAAQGAASPGSQKRDSDADDQADENNFEAGEEERS